jgi:hypothetical protein
VEHLPHFLGKALFNFPYQGAENIAMTLHLSSRIFIFIEKKNILAKLPIKAFVLAIFFLHCSLIF